jgi:hypothetical protein
VTNNIFTSSNWRKSSFSEAGNCVEVSTHERSVFVRDSKHKNPEEKNEIILAISPSGWREFIQAIKG